MICLDINANRECKFLDIANNCETTTLPSLRCKELDGLSRKDFESLVVDNAS